MNHLKINQQPAQSTIENQSMILVGGGIRGFWARYQGTKGYLSTAIPVQTDHRHTYFIQPHVFFGWHWVTYKSTVWHYYYLNMRTSDETVLLYSSTCLSVQTQLSAWLRWWIISAQVRSWRKIEPTSLISFFRRVQSSFLRLKLLLSMATLFQL